MDNSTIPTTSLSPANDEGESITSGDSKALQKILPEEVWLIITEKLLTKQTEENEMYGSFEFLNNSSPYFRTLLQPKRVLALFHMVLWIAYPWVLATTEDDKGTNSDSDWETNWKNIDEDSDVDSNADEPAELHEHKPISIIKTCREVCSAWNFAVDQLIFEKYIPHEKKGMHSLEKRVLRNMEYEQFGNSSDVNKFLTFFKDTHPKMNSECSLSNGLKDRSPFISKEVEIHLHLSGAYDHENNHDPGFPEAIESLLNTYGRHIWSFEVYINGRDVDTDDQLESLAKAFNYFKVIPKLQRLAICDNASNSVGSLDEALVEEDREIQDDPQYQLPHFPHLVELNTKGLAIPIFNHLIRNNSHISVLKVNRSPGTNYDIANLPFPNLRTLNLNFWSMEHVDMLENVEMPFVRTLKFSYSNGHEFPEYVRIFRVIGYNWWDTLTNLDLHLPQAQSAEDYKNVLEDTADGGLDLPNLLKFHLTIYQPFFLDFLLPTRKALERLYILQINNPTFFATPSISKKAKRNESIQFLGADGSLMDSNIWQLFPRLEDIRTVGCKRDGDTIEQFSRSQWMNSRKKM